MFTRLFQPIELWYNINNIDLLKECVKSIQFVLQGVWAVEKRLY